MTFYIYSNGDLADADQVNANFNEVLKLQGEKAINDVSATNSGVLAGSSQVLIDKFLDANGQNNTVDIYAIDAFYNNTNKCFLCGSSGNGIDIADACLSSGGTSGGTDSRGQVIVVTNTCYLVNITKHASCTGTRAKLLKSNGTVIAMANFSGNTATFSSQIILQNGTTYIIEIDNNGSSFNMIDSISGLTYPYNRTNVSFTSASRNGTNYSTTRAYAMGVTTQNANTNYTDSTIQSVATTIPTGMTKVFVTPLMYEALATGDNITADVSIDNGAHYTTGIPINTWTPITSANGTQLIVKANLLTGTGSTSPKISGWRVLME